MRQRFEEVLRRHLRGVPPDAQIPFDADLVNIGLDSVGTITLLLDLEDAFGISFPSSMLNPETFRTPATLERALGSLVGERA